MNKKILLLCLCLSAHLLPAQPPQRYSRVRIDLQNQSLDQLAATGIELEHGEFAPGRTVTVELSESELKTVRDAGFVAEVLIPDLKTWFLENSQRKASAPRGADCNPGASALDKWKTPANYNPGTMGGYFTYAELLAALDAMRAKFPNLITARAVVSDTIVTHEGRPLWWVKISDNADSEEPEPEALYTALHHAREPNSLSQLVFYLWYLLENYATDDNIRYLVDNTELYFIPCINPDGYLFNEATDPLGGGFWRKNRRDNGDGTFGVDLNRNYGYQWGFNDQGSSPNPNSETYRGPAAFSEPETRMVRDFCLQHNFRFTLNYHTRGNLLIYPWAYSDELADPALAEFAVLMTRENDYHYGTSIQTVGYRVNGSSDDWMFGGADILSYTPEVGPSVWGFWPPADEIDGLNKANVWQNLVAGYSLLRFGVLTDRGGSSIDVSKPQIDYSLKRYGFEDGPLTVSVTALSPNVTAVGAPVVHTLAQFEHADGTIPITLAAGIKPGDVALFLLQLDNGKTQFSDTLKKVFLGPTVVAFQEPTGTELGSQWSALGPWDITYDQYVSAPSSITDSPAGDYESASASTLELASPVAIPASAKTAQLRFFARWTIEPDFDLVQVYANSPGVGLQALCGRYTKPGSIFQGEDTPVFDGFQDNWVEECMDLSAYIGENVTLQFTLISDDFQEFDGFYFDDLVIEYSSGSFVGVTPLAARQFALRQNQPNPARRHTSISWQNDGNALRGAATLTVYNLLGKRVWEQAVDVERQQKVALDTSGWPAGQYWYRLVAENGQSEPRQMTVMGQ